MWTQNVKAISEVNKILNQMDITSRNKIPKELLNEIQNNAIMNVDYIKKDIPLEDLNLEEETKEILAVISYNYFCTSKEKEEWNLELKENEKRYQNELIEKYNPENLFKKEDEEKSLVEYKESFFKKIWNRIVKILRKK